MDNERDRDPIVNTDSKSLKRVNNECDSQSCDRDPSSGDPKRAMKGSLWEFYRGRYSLP